VLACLEADREQDAHMLKVWERIAAKFRSHAASVLLVSMLVSGVGSPTPAEASEGSRAGSSCAAMYIMLRDKLRLARRAARCRPNEIPVTPSEILVTKRSKA
ncbi:MAG: hypothetical protein ACRETD_07625, partial [Steroidobacteraceae bacterium]